MKKFFGILLAVVTTLVLLPCCGGGGDDEGAGVMGVYDFVNGNKIFKFGGQNGQSTLFLAGTNSGAQVSVDGDKATNARYTAGVGGKGSMSERGTANYTVVRDPDTGNIISAELEIAFDDAKMNDDIVQFFGFEGDPNDENNNGGAGGNAGGGAGGDDEEEGEGESSVLLISIDFENNAWVDNQGHNGTLWVEFR